MLKEGNMKKYFEFNKPFLKFLPLFIIMFGLIVALGNSYALMDRIAPDPNGYQEKLDNIKVIYINKKDNVFNLEDKEIEFKIKNTSYKKVTYNVYLEFKDDNKKIKYQVVKNNKKYLDNILGEDNYIDKLNTIKGYETVSYKVKIDSQDEYKDKYKIIVEES